MGWGGQSWLLARPGWTDVPATRALVAVVAHPRLHLTPPSSVAHLPSPHIQDICPHRHSCGGSCAQLCLSWPLRTDCCTHLTRRAVSSRTPQNMGKGDPPLMPQLPPGVSEPHPALSCHQALGHSGSSAQGCRSQEWALGQTIGCHQLKLGRSARSRADRDRAVGHDIRYPCGEMRLVPGPEATAGACPGL